MSGNDPDVKANKLQSMKTDQVIARAQRILDARGEPPYGTDACLSPDDAAVLSEFVYFWRPYLVRKA